MVVLSLCTLAQSACLPAHAIQLCVLRMVGRSLFNVPLFLVGRAIDMPRILCWIHQYTFPFLSNKYKLIK